MESDYLDFKLGAKADAQMRATEEARLFKAKGEIYYSIFSKKPFEAPAMVEVVIKNTANLAAATFSESLGTTPEKKNMRPFNPVNADAAGRSPFGFKTAAVGGARSVILPKMAGCDTI